LTVTVQAYAMSPEAEAMIEEQNQRIADLVAGIRSVNPRTKLLEIQQARRIIELQKVPTFVNLATTALERGRSVVLFVNFNASSDALAEALKAYKPYLYVGDTPMRDRPRIADAFQQGTIDLLITHHAVAREGISWHDIRGGKPRTIIISPNESGITLVQVLGRADRLCRLSDTEQIIVYAQSTDPEKPGWDARIAEIMIGKLRNIKELNIGEDADDYMKELYEHAAKVKRVDYAPKKVRLSAKRYVDSAQPLSPEISAEAELQRETGLNDEPSDD
jgi:superfamily II DNA or RNA helicase